MALLHRCTIWPGLVLAAKLSFQTLQQTTLNFIVFNNFFFFCWKCFKYLVIIYYFLLYHYKTLFLVAYSMAALRKSDGKKWHFSRKGALVKMLSDVVYAFGTVIIFCDNLLFPQAYFVILHCSFQLSLWSLYLFINYC